MTPAVQAAGLCRLLWLKSLKSLRSRDTSSQLFIQMYLRDDEDDTSEEIDVDTIPNIWRPENRPEVIFATCCWHSHAL